jgi:general secretion pathway protein G
MIVRTAGRDVRRRSAFTLLEVLVVVAILVILASVGTISVIRYLDSAKADTATLQMQTLQKQCMAYYTQSGGQWPQSLNDLVNNPSGSMLEGGMQALIDPWGQPYQYTIRQNPVSGQEEPFISTVTPKGMPISWPRQ